MSSTTLTLDILTPMGAMRSGTEVAGVEVPGALGELGILPHHESLLTAIVPGVVRFREGTTDVRLAVGGGFLEVKEAGRAVILCDRAVTEGQVNREEVQTALREVMIELDRDRGPTEALTHRALLDERAWLEAQLRIAPH